MKRALISNELNLEAAWKVRRISTYLLTSQLTTETRVGSFGDW